VKENRELRGRVESLEQALTTSNTTFGTMVIRDLGARDGYTHRHAAATATYAADLAREMKLDEARVGRLRMAGLLHNIGLFGLPEDLLLATGKLNSIAQSRLAEHSARGEEALAAVPEFEEMASRVRWHHARSLDTAGSQDTRRGAGLRRHGARPAPSSRHGVRGGQGEVECGHRHRVRRGGCAGAVEAPGYRVGRIPQGRRPPVRLPCSGEQGRRETRRA
jgi:hypothetical protein